MARPLKGQEKIQNILPTEEKLFQQLIIKYSAFIAPLKKEPQIRTKSHMYSPKSGHHSL